MQGCGRRQQGLRHPLAMLAQQKRHDGCDALQGVSCRCSVTILRHVLVIVLLLNSICLQRLRRLLHLWPDRGSLGAGRQ